LEGQKIMETMTDTLPDDILDSLRQAFNSALINAVPYVLARDLRQDYPEVKFDALLATIKEFIAADSNLNAATTGRRTPCIILSYEFPGFRPPGQALNQGLDLRDYLHTNVQSL
jgi:hypothetical protein